jgi:cytochrome c553
VNMRMIMTMARKLLRRNLLWAAALALVPALAIVAEPPQQNAGKDLSWAFPVPSKDQPKEEDAGPRHIPGSTKAFTQAQIDDLFNPPVWFPEQYASAPPTVVHGKPPDVPGCGSCHLMSGMGHAESSQLAGLSSGYIVEQMNNFKSGDRKDPARMTAIGKAISMEDAQQAADYFSALKPIPWNKVVEADMVPKTFVNNARQRLPLPGGGTEPIGNRIIEVPVDPALALARDPRSSFTDYVPTGSIAKGNALASTGGDGKTLPCGICHGTTFTGVGDVPRLAGLSPIYIARQLYRFQNGDRGGDAAELMKPAVAQLQDDDIIALAAFLASQPPQ